MTNALSLSEQVRQALDTYTYEHTTAEPAAAAYSDLRRLVGSNEAERKERRSTTPPEDYAAYQEQLVKAEAFYKTKAAAAERAEKALNTLRELLQRETADLARAAAADFLQGTAVLHRTIDAYRRSTGTKPLMSEIGRRVEALNHHEPTGAVDPDDGSVLPF